MAFPDGLISAAQLSELPPTEILGGTRFIARGLNVVFGASGAFKSFYTLDAALTVAQSAPVVYVAAEGVGSLYRRVSAWCEYYQQPPGSLYFICKEINLLDITQVRALVAISTPVQPVLMVFDTLARCIPGGDENSAKDMGLAVRNATLIQRELGCANTWVHHTNRAERGERGSGAIRGAADTMIELTASGDNIIRVSCSKLKDDDPWETEEMRFHTVGQSGILLPNGTGDTTRLSAQELQILEFLALEIFETVGAKALQIVNGVNISERNVYRVLSHLKRELHISHGNKGDPYCITEKGKSLVCKKTAKSGSLLNLVKPAG